MIPAQALSPHTTPTSTSWWSKTKIATVAVGGALLALVGLGGGAYLYRTKGKKSGTYQSIEEAGMPSGLEKPSLSPIGSLQLQYNELERPYFKNRYDITRFENQFRSMQSLFTDSILQVLVMEASARVNFDDNNSARNELNQLTGIIKSYPNDIQRIYFGYWNDFFKRAS